MSSDPEAAKEQLWSKNAKWNTPECEAEPSQ